MLNIVDAAIARFISSAAHKRGASNRIDYLDERKADENVEHLKSLMAEIYVNTAALLGHISAMIAALSIMLVVFEKLRVIRIIVEIEMSIYVLLALMCVYNVRWRHAFPLAMKGRSEIRIDTFYRSYVKRRFIYKYCTDMVIITTAAFLITLLCHILLDVWS